MALYSASITFLGYFSMYHQKEEAKSTGGCLIHRHRFLGVTYLECKGQEKYV